MTANHKVFNEEGESRNNHRYAVVVPDLATQQNQSLQNQNFSGDRRESTKVPRTVAKTKSYKNGQFRWNLSNLVKIYHGIIEHQHLTDPRRMLLLKTGYAEKRKDLQQYCRNLAWMEKWWADSVECFCYLRKTGKLRMKVDLKNHSKGQ